MEGFLCVDKEEGCTSRDVVNSIQRLVRPAKVGHAGTLDPMATGVLVIAVGRGTRLIQYVQKMPKTYVAKFQLGKTSDTEDITGNVTDHPVTSPPNIEAIRDVCNLFIGRIEQRPPAFSALKVKGRRAYDLARKGKKVELEARPIDVYDINLDSYKFPDLALTVRCGSGTYIRSLGRDIGEHLGCGAVMSSLRRSAIGDFKIEDAIPSQEIDAPSIEQQLQPLNMAVSHLPVQTLDAHQRNEIGFGRKICFKPTPTASEIAAVGPSTELLAVLTQDPPGWYRPSINFSNK